MIGRIQSRRVFERVRRAGVHVRSGRLSCTMVIDSTLAGPHVGYAIGRSYGSAVARNRMKRRLRALIATHDARLPAGYFVVGASPKAAGLSSDQLAHEVAEIVRLCDSRAQTRTTS